MAVGLLATGGPGPGFYSAPPSARRSDLAGPLRVQAGRAAQPTKRRARYTLSAASLERDCPWFKQALAYWQGRLGDSVAARFAISTRLHDIKDSTLKNYAGKWEIWVAFCEEEGLCPLPAHPDSLELYVGWHASRGTVHADSLGQYFAAVTKAHEHCGFDSPMMGNSEISKTVKGLALLQKSVYDVDAVLYLPASHAAAVWDWAILQVPAIRSVCDSLAATGRMRHKRLSTEARQQLQSFRDAVMLVFNFCDFGRADSQFKMRGADVSLDSRLQCVFRLRHVKNRSGNKTNLLYQWPDNARPGLNELMQFYRFVRARLGCSDAALMWRLPWATDKWDTHYYDKRLRLCLARHDLTAPAGFSYSSRSLRAGAVSAAKAIGVDLDTIRFLGGWSPTSSVPERTYLDRTCQADPSAWRFFGWLIPVRR